MTAAKRLAGHLAGLTATDMRDLSERAGVHPKMGMLARAGRTICADAYLRLCAVAGIDPITGETAERRAPGPLLFWFFASGLIVSRLARNLALREAARVIGVSSATLSRAENAKPICIESYLKIGAFIGVQPSHYVETRSTIPVFGQGVSVPVCRETAASKAA